MSAKINETSCVVKLQGRSFEARGAYVDNDVAVVYVSSTLLPDGFEKDLTITDWRGNVLTTDVVVTSERLCWGNRIGQYTMRCVRFTIDGVTYAGRYNSDWSQLVRGRRVKGGGG